jgi:hypothetical protein
MDTIEGGRLHRCRWLTGGETAPPTAGLGRGLFTLREQFELGRRGGRALDPVGQTGRTVRSEQLRGPFTDRQQADNAFLCLDNAAFPGVEVNAERLGEAPHDIVDQREALGGLAATVFLFIEIVRLRITVLFGLGGVSGGRTQGP